MKIRNRARKKSISRKKRVKKSTKNLNWEVVWEVNYFRRPALLYRIEKTRKRHSYAPIRGCVGITERVYAYTTEA